MFHWRNNFTSSCGLYQQHKNNGVLLEHQGGYDRSELAIDPETLVVAVKYIASS